MRKGCRENAVIHMGTMRAGAVCPAAVCAVPSAAGQRNIRSVKADSVPFADRQRNINEKQLQGRHRGSQRRLRHQIYRNAARSMMLILGGIILIGFVSFLISAFETGSRSRVYAVDARTGKNGYQSDFQAGLMGVMNGVTGMQNYSNAVRLSSFEGGSEEVLAGARAVNKLAIHQRTMEEGTRKASELGYYALQTVQQSQMSENEYYTLLQIVEAEATGGDVMSKMMVAGVVMNRVRDSRFPDTIYDVVWQTVNGYPQFQPTQDGRFYSCSVTDTTVEAVDRVLAGEDYSQGALFFIARNFSAAENAQWFDDSLVRLFEYGGHEYYTFQDE